MHYAFMSFSCPELSLPEMLRVATDLGYEGIEPRLGQAHAHGIEVGTPARQLAAYRRQAEDAGVAICCLATGCRFADPQTCQSALDELHQAVDLAAALGCPRLRVFGGPLGLGLERAEAIELVAECLVKGAELAGPAEISLCLESHDAWTNPEHLAAVMRRADHAFVAINWDAMHPVRQSGWTVADSFRVLQPWIRHVHVHDGTLADPLELRPMGQGEIDHREVIRLLQQDQYDGFVSGEWIKWTPWQEHLGPELATLRGYETPER